MPDPLPNMPDPGAWWDSRNWSAYRGIPASAPAQLGKSYSGSNKMPGPEKEEDPMVKMLRDFFAEMNAPLDLNDPAVQQVLNQMRQSTQQRAGNSGIFGGYSNNLGEQAYAKGANQLAMQKKSMAGNALGMLTGASQNQRNFDYGKRQDQYQSDMDAWKLDRDQGPGAMIGGGLGGVIGGIGGFFGGDIAGGAKAGFDIGRGIGGSIGAPPPPRWSGGGY